jgi:hypothetical protein
MSWLPTPSCLRGSVATSTDERDRVAARVDRPPFVPRASRSAMFEMISAAECLVSAERGRAPLQTNPADCTSLQVATVVKPRWQVSRMWRWCFVCLCCWPALIGCRPVSNTGNGSPISRSSANEPLAVELSALSPTVRMNRPMPTVWEVTRHTPSLLEGRLEFIVKLGPHVFLRHSTDELVFHQAVTRLRLLLPPVTGHFVPPELEVDIVWWPKVGGRIPLAATQLLRLPTNAYEIVGMLVGEEQRNDLSTTGEREQLLNSLKLEALALETVQPESPTERTFDPWPIRQQMVQTIYNSLTADVLPTEPLAYTAYDLVCLRADTFARMPGRTLNAVAAWVRAGGSVYVEATAPLEREHFEFLRQLSGTSKDLWGLDPQGRLIDSQSGALAGRRLILADYGRAVVMGPATINVIPSTEETLSNAWFLWKGPLEGQTPTLLSENSLALRWLTPVFSSLHQGNLENRNPLQAVSVTDSLSLQINGLLTAALLPDNFWLIPGWLFAVVLLAIAVWMGLGERLVLGRLRLLRWTWITWPAGLIAVTIGMVQLSEWSLRDLTSQKTLTLSDVDAEGQVLRSNRFGITIPRSSSTVTLPQQRELWLPLQSGPLYGRSLLVGVNTFVQNSANATIMIRGQIEHSVSSVSQGRFPSRYTVERPVMRITPELDRVLEIPLPQSDTAAAEPFDWHTLPWLDAVLNDNQPFPEPVLAQFRERYGKNMILGVFRRVDGRLLISDPAAEYRAEFTDSTTSQSLIAAPWQRLEIRSSQPTPDATSYPTAMLPHWLQASIALSIGTANTFQPPADAWLSAPLTGPLTDVLVWSPQMSALLLVMVPDDKGWTVYRRPILAAGSSSNLVTTPSTEGHPVQPPSAPKLLESSP